MMKIALPIHRQETFSLEIIPPKKVSVIGSEAVAGTY